MTKVGKNVKNKGNFNGQSAAKLLRCICIICIMEKVQRLGGNGFSINYIEGLRYSLAPSEKMHIIKVWVPELYGNF